MKILTQEKLKELFLYDEKSGSFTRLKNKGKEIAGTIAGNISNSTGYIYIKIDYKLYAAHSLAFLYMLGRLPPDKVDHKNLNKIDNSWVNLRECSTSENGFNAKTRLDNILGIKGLQYNPRLKQYQARITKEGKIYRKTFAVKSLGDDKARELTLIWLKETRVNLHREYANHGS